MSSIPEFIRTEQNGIEYFTIVATGECGMSQSGLARACGIRQQSLFDLIENLTGKAPSEWLEPFVGKDLNLTGDFSKKGGDVVVYQADFCSAVIGHYASKGRAKALKVLISTNRIGLTSYIQGVTGWLPIALQSSQESRTELDRILDRPIAYKVFYEPLLYQKAVKMMGVGFYWHYCYDFLTLAERCKLNLVNQPTPNGRINYIHQHISPDTLPKLEKYLIQLAVVVNLASDRQDFDALYQLEFFGNKQLNMKLQINPNTGK